MSTIVIDAALRERFLAAGGVVEVRDEDGELLGKFHPAGPDAPPAGYAIQGEWPSDEEIDRRLQTGPWHSAADIEAFIAELKRGGR